MIPGTILAGKYRYERDLGHGAHGLVVLATHVALAERVALKILNASMPPEVATRFAREARLAVRLKGDHVVRVMDAGHLETGEPFIAMELLEGTDLATVVKERKPLPIHQACDYVLQACVGLAEAHALGMVHRDVKPANLFVTTGPRGAPLVKVLDFGISKAAAGSLTTSGEELLGTPRYMAPEQILSSRDVDPRVDVWSLGVVLFELLAGRPPFEASGLSALFRQILDEPAPSLTTLRQDIPSALADTLARCLDKDPVKRPANVAELAALLAPSGGPGGAAWADRAADYLGVSVPKRAAIATKPPRSRWWLYVAVAALSAATGASVVGARLWRAKVARRSATSASTTSTASSAQVVLGEPVNVALTEPSFRSAESESPLVATPSSSHQSGTHVQTVQTMTTPQAPASAGADTLASYQTELMNAILKRDPKCLDAWAHLETSPTYANALSWVPVHAQCLMLAGRCDEGRALLRPALKQILPPGSDVEAQIRGYAQMDCPTQQLTPEELGAMNFSAIQGALSKHDAATAAKRADELAPVLPKLPQTTADERGRFEHYTLIVGQAYVAAGRCNDAKKYLTDYCKRRAIDGHVDACVTTWLRSVPGVQVSPCASAAP